MLEYILIFAVISAACSGFATYRWLTVKRPTATTKNGKAESGTTPPAPATSEHPKPPRLEILGAIHPRTGDFAFLKSLGLGNAPIYDLCFLPGPLTKDQLPPLVASTLEQMHQEGDAVGPDVMDFVHLGKTLKDTEALYFVLLAQTSPTGHRVVAFVDKRRWPAAN
jgi:hypothetical protein